MSDFRQGAPAALLGLTLVESVISPTELGEKTAQMVVDTSRPTELLGIGISLATYLISTIAEAQGISPQQVVVNSRAKLLELTMR